MKDEVKILLINGSPKGEKSDTMHITRAFLEGFKTVKSAKIEVITTINNKINYCLGCFSCKKNGGTCVHNDDMREILEKILNSDILLFSFPLYCYGMPANIKVLLDRTMPLSSMKMRKSDGRYEHVCQADFSHLKYIMICGCGFPNSQNNFEPMIQEFKLMFPNNHTIITVPESPMFNVKEASDVTIPFLEKVKEAGKIFAISNELNQDIINELRKPMIPEEIYAKICNGEC